jgi:CRP-like cAMP-binding protein
MCGLDLRLKILGQVPFFAGLDADALQAVNRLFREHGYAPQETICAAGDPATRLFVVAAGKVKRLRHTLGGQEVLLEVLVPGEFFGSLSALGDSTYADTAIAQTQCCILSIAADAFQSILRQHPPVALAVLDTVSRQLRGAHEVIQQLSGQPVEGRVATTLLKLADKLGEPQRGLTLIQMPLSRQDLAAMTGATVETVSRVMSQFRRGGLIRTGRQWVAIADRRRLAEIAEESA